MKHIFQTTLFICTVFLLTSGCKNDTSATSPTVGMTPYQVTEHGLEWYDIDDLDKMADLGDKKVLVDMWTTWCGWCRVMDRKTFSDPEVVKYLQDNFVLVKFNAEQKDPVTFKGQTYEWMPGGRRGVHKLAMKMMSGRMSYPTMVYLDANKDVITSVPGYKTPEQFLGDLAQLDEIKKAG